MMGTYFCSAIIFPDDPTDYMENYKKTGIDDIPFETWLHINFYQARQHIIDGIQIENQLAYSGLTYEFIYTDYLRLGGGWESENLFDIYDYETISGAMNWYQSAWVQGQGIFEWLAGSTRAERIDDEYFDYRVKIGVEEAPEGNIIDQIMSLLTNIWEGLTQFLRLITFQNVPNMPLWVGGILAVFFVPMWIVLIVGLTPYVTDMIRAIASFIQSLVPW